MKLHLSSFSQRLKRGAKPFLLLGIGVMVPSLLLATALLLLTRPVTAAPMIDVSGPINTNTTWSLANSPYTVTGDVTIQNGAVLTIEAGVTVYFAAGTGLVVADGRLVAVGTATEHIHFEPSPTSRAPGDWKGLSFGNASLPSTLRYCWISDADTGISCGDSDNHIIDHCWFHDNGDGGDLTSGGAINSEGDLLTVTNNQIWQNELGMRLRKSFNNTISNNDIHDNDGFGIGFYAVGAPGGGNNTISDNLIQENGGFGLGFIAQSGQPGGSDNLIVGNEIRDNGGDGLILDDGSNNQVLNNEIRDNSGHGVWTRSQVALQLVGNALRGNGQTGLSYASPNAIPAAIQANALCNNTSFEIQNQWATTLLAEGNWFGTNTPDPAEFSGAVDYTPWISMALAATPSVLPADGMSTAVVTITMNGGGQTLPDGYELYLSASPGGSLSPTPVILAGGQATATYTASTSPGPVHLTVTDPCNSLTFSDLLLLQAVDMAVYKTGPGGSTLPGETISYTIVVSEQNGLDAANVVLTDLLPGGTTWLGDTSAGCGLVRQSTAPSVVWSKALWQGGTACEFTVTVAIENQACQAERLVNTVSVSSATADDDLSNNSWTTTDDSPAIHCLDLAVTKTGGDLIIGPNKEYWVDYTIVVSNTGPMTATNVIITDDLPVEADYAGSGAWICNAGRCHLAAGTLAPSASVQISLPLQLDKLALDCPVVLTNVVRVADGTLAGDLNEADNVFTLTTGFACLPDLVVVKNDNVGRGPTARMSWLLDKIGLPPMRAQQQRDCVRAGELITYLVSYVNTGPETATGVVLTESLPANTSYVGYGWTDVGGGVYTRAVGTLLPDHGGVAQFAVRVDSLPPDRSIENEVRVGGDQDDMDPADNVSYDQTPICDQVLLISKDDNTPCVSPGDEIHYTIVVTNPTGAEITGVVLTETLPNDVDYVESTGWLPLGGGQFAHDGGDLGPYGSESVEFVVRVHDAVPTSVTEIVNTVCASGAGTGPSCYQLITPLPLMADLRVVKHDHVGPPPSRAKLAELDRFYQVLYGAEPPAAVRQVTQLWEPVRPGDVYSYTITYLNLGRIPASGVLLTETLPARTSYVGYGWTHLGGNTYGYQVGDLLPREGGQIDFWVRVDPTACSSQEYLYNWVTIGGNEPECNLDNNWSGEETPAELPACEYDLYLPLVCKGGRPEPPTPTPEPPTPTATPPTPTPPPPPRAYVSDVEVNPETNRVYVASPQQNAVLAIDPSGAGTVLDTIPVGDYPLGLAVVTTTNKIYAANFNSWTLTAIRGSDHARLADIYVGAQACKAAADAGDARVYVTNHLESDNGAAAVNSQTDTFEYYYSRLHATQGRYGIDVDPDADRLFIAARDAGLIAILDAFQPDQEPQIFKLDPPRVPFVVAFNPASGHLFATAPYDDLVVVLDPDSIRWDQGRWTTIQHQRVFLLDQANAGWIAEIGVGAGAEEGIALNPRTGYVYVTNGESDTVSIIHDDPNPANIHWIQDVSVGDYPQGVAVDVERNIIYVGNAGSRDLSVIDGASHTVIKTIPLD